MREILFRAKRIDYDKFPKEEWWIEGNAFVHDDGRTVDISTGTEKFSINKRVIPETLCQYTGLKDKNGNRIYENDIISINTYDYMEPSEDFFGEVVYCEAWACWCIQQPDNEKPIPLCECEGSYQTDIFVEGNTFDNPELLEGCEE